MREPVRSERVLSRVAAAVAAVLGAAWLVASPAAPQRAEAVTSAESRMAAEIVSQINGERAARGLSQLGVDGSLQSRAQTIAESNRASNCHACHSSSLGDGEVVQWSGGPGASGRSTVAWMLSTAHRDILMSPALTAIGVGLACHPDGGQEAVGRVSGQVTKGAPAAPVVTSRQSGSGCGSSPTTTTKPLPTFPPTTSGGQSSGQQSKGDTGVSPGPAPTAAPGAAAAPARMTTTTARKATPKVALGRSATTTAPTDDVDAALVPEIFDTTTTLEPPATTTVAPDEGTEAAAGARDLDNTVTGASGRRTSGAVVVGLGMAAMLGVAAWRSRAGWAARGLRR